MAAHFIVADDVERSRRFYTDVLGGPLVFAQGDLRYVSLANTFVIINVGGGPTDDKPSVTLETPSQPRPGEQLPQPPSRRHCGQVRRVEGPGTEFLTPPIQHEFEIRCYIRDPDGHLIEVGQTTDPERDWSPTEWTTSPAADVPVIK